MPETRVHFYQEQEDVPVYDWLLDLARRDRQALANCIAKIRLLASEGYELWRPHADYLRDGIYELRAKRGHLNYRILYFFHEKTWPFLPTDSLRKRKFPRPTFNEPFKGRIAMNSNRKGTAHKSKSRKTSDALEIVEKHLIGGGEEMQALVEAATLNAQVAQSIYEARTKAALTQTELAKLVGTTQSVISQLENADYEGHSLSMLRRIAVALHLRVEMKLVPESAAQSA